MLRITIWRHRIHNPHSDLLHLHHAHLRPQPLALEANITLQTRPQPSAHRAAVDSDPSHNHDGPMSFSLGLVLTRRLEAKPVVDAGVHDHDDSIQGPVRNDTVRIRSKYLPKLHSQPRENGAGIQDIGRSHYSMAYALHCRNNKWFCRPRSLGQRILGHTPTPSP